MIFSLEIKIWNYSYPLHHSPGTLSYNSYMNQHTGNDSWFLVGAPTGCFGDTLATVQLPISDADHFFTDSWFPSLHRRTGVFHVLCLDGAQSSYERLNSGMPMLSAKLV